MPDPALSHNDIITLRFVQKQIDEDGPIVYYISLMKNGSPYKTFGPYDKTPSLVDALLWVGTQMKLEDN